ncbi:uncharacterized protein LOC133831759 isoform X2 [Humulus lupulus]|uniref:uncharacterized protein LOC133831759 isoform X2 n=1 Tax=Humulus lupulus TaxID=3486 RepID=UPI002B40ACCC|nr:uncharacterized protein LOC133831759 isoform X2 [Humulus lupulus]
MEVSSCSDKSEWCQDVSSFGSLPSSIKENYYPEFDSVDDLANELDDLVNELDTAISLTLHVKEEEEQLEHDNDSSNGDDDDVSNVKERHGCEGHEIEYAKPSQKSLSKCLSLPVPDREDGELGTSTKGPFSEGPSLSAYSRSKSLPTPLKPVSAMKGSREKRGASVMKLSVSWAPDVYDPIPTSLSHTFTGSKKQQHKSKNNKKNWKNGKKGQKGNSSRGSSGKDKKQRDSKSNCGTSFLKNSHTKMHYPVAEAL